jgi:hypothetical protein
LKKLGKEMTLSSIIETGSKLVSSSEFPRDFRTFLIGNKK